MVTKPVGFWVRFFANLVDGLLLMIVCFPFVLFMSKSGADVFNGVVEFFYMLLLPLFWYGYTLGKRSLGVRIVTLNGESPTLWTMVKRNILATLVYAIPLLIGIVYFLSVVYAAPAHVSNEFLSLLNQGIIGESVVAEQHFYQHELFIPAGVPLLISLLGTFVMYIISACMIGIRKDKRSLHDLIAGTYVTFQTPSTPIEEEKKSE